MAIFYYKRNRDKLGYNPKRDKPSLELVRREGLRFLVSGEEIELFTIKILAEAIDRRPTIIHAWEKEYGFPKPLFRIRNRPGYRYYSGQQVINLHNLVITKYGGRKYFQDTAEFQKFVDDMKSVFHEQQIVVKGEGRFDVSQ